MKTPKKLSGLLLSAILILPVPALAQLTWGTGGTGGTGTWDSSTLDWYNGSSNVAWLSGDAAAFSGTAGTVTISGTQTASQLTFNASGTYTLTRTTAAGTLLQGTSSGLIIETDSNAEIDAQISSTTNVTKTGAGTLSLGGNFVQSSSFTIQAGTLEVGSGPVNGIGVETQLKGSTIVNNGVILFNANGLGVIGDQISGTGSIHVATIQGAGLGNSNNTYTGATIIDSGELYGITLANGGVASSIGESSSAAANLIFGNGAIEFSGSIDRLFTIGDAAGNSAYVGSGGSVSFTNTGSIAFGTSGAHTLTLGSDITGSTGVFAPSLGDQSVGSPTSLIKEQVGTWTLTGANTYTGLTSIFGGTLNLGSSGALGGGGNITFGGGTLQYSTSNTNDYSSKIVNSTGAISIDTNNQNVTFASGLTSSNTGGLAKLGVGTLTLSGSNTYTGTSSVINGTLSLIATGSLAGSSVATSGLGIFSEASGATITGVGKTFTQGSSGTSTLAGTNSYTGATSVTAGTLSIGATGSLAGSSVSTSGTGVISEVGGGSISGAGSTFTQASSGTSTLAGANTYTGATSVNVGTLNLSATGSLAGSNISTSYQGIFSEASGGSISGIGTTFTQGGGNTSYLDGVNTYTGATSVMNSTLDIGGSLAGSNVSTSSTGFIIEGTGGSITGTGITFTQNSSYGSFLYGTNTYTGGTSVIASTLTIGGSLAGSNVSTSGTGVVSELSGGSITGSGTTFTQGSIGTSTLAGSNAFTGLTSINAGILNLGSSGALDGGGNITFGGGTLQYSVSNTNDYSSAIVNSTGAISIDTNSQNVTYASSLASSNTGGLTKLGAGTLILDGANTYTGTTSVTAGTLSMGAYGSLAGSNVSTSGTGVISEVSGGSITGTGATFTQGSSGTSTLAGANTFTGATSVTAGTLSIGATGSLAGSNVSTSGTGVISEASNGSITGDGTIFTQGSSGTSTLAGTNSYSGLTSLDAGILNLGSSGALGGGGSITFAGGTLQYSASNTNDYSSEIVNSTGAISIDTNSQNVTYASGLASSNIGGLTKLGLGTLSLTGANVYTGVTTVSAGELDLNTTGGQSVGGSLTVNGGTTKLLQANQINNAGNLVVSSGTFNIQSFNQTMANVQLIGGTIAGSGGTLTSSSAYDIEAGSASAILGGALGLNKTTAGTATLSGANIYTGTTNINGGILNLSSSGAFGGGGNITFGGGTLQYSAANTTDYSSKIVNSTGAISINTNGQNVTYSSTLGSSNTNGLTKFGAGTLALNGTDAYTGLTSISAGTLNLGSSGALGGGGNITFGGGNLQYSASNTTDYSSKIVNSTGAISINTNGQNVTYASALSSSNTDGLTKSGAGTLTLSGANRYTGSTVIAGGTLQLGNQISLYDGTTASWTATNIVVFNGSTLALNVGGGGQFTSANLGTLLALGTSSGGFENGSTIGLDTTNANGGNFAYSSVIANPNSGANALGLTKLGTNKLTLSGNNIYTGGTTINNGTLAINTVASVGSAQPLGKSNTVTFTGASSSAAGVLQYAGGNSTLYQNLTVAPGDYGVVVNSGGGILNLNGTLSKSGSVLTLAGGKFVISGSITGSSPNSDLDLGSTTYGGTATVGLTSANSYNGPTIITDGTTLLTGVNGALPTATPSAITLGASSDTSGQANTLDLLGTTQTINSLISIGSGTNQVISSNGTAGGTPAIGTGASSSTGSVTVNYSGTSTDTFSGSLGDSNATRAANNFSLTKSGAGTLILTGTNTYKGGTTVNGGTLLANSTNSTGSGQVTVNSGGTLGGAGTIATSGVSSGNAVTIQSGGTLNQSVVSGGLGTSTLTLNLHNTGTITTVDLLQGAKLAFDLGTSGVSDQMDITGGTLTLNGQNFSDFTFTTLSGFTGTGTYDLFSTDGSGDIFGSLGTAMGTINGYNATLSVFNSQDLVLTVAAAPEPSTWAMLLGGLGLLLFWRTRCKDQA